MEVQGTQRVAAATLASKFKSKKEIWYLLTTEARIYLCDYRQLTIYFLKDIASGKRKHIKCDDVRHIWAPYYKTLSMESILDQVDKFPEILEFLPEPKDWERLPRQWLLNIFGTVVWRPFELWINDKMEERNAKLATERNLLVDLHPDVFNAFNQSKNVSTAKGVGAFLCKAGTKRRRTQAQIQNDAEEQESSAARDAALKSKIAKLEADLEERKEKDRNGENAASILTNLIEMGACRLEEDGSVTVLSNAQEFNSVRHKMLQL